VPAIRQAILDRDPDVPLSNVATMGDIVSESLSQSRILSVATGLFAVTALLLSLMGLYAVLAFYVARRAREIGIRVAFGATGGHVGRMVLARGMMLVGGGLVVGLLGAGAVAWVLRSMLFEVGATAPGTFGLVAVGFLLVGALASWAPARRATRLDPVRVIQAE
jgi:putative ABC transport system permease protein